MIFSHIITNPAVKAIALSAGLLFSALSGSAGNIESKTQERESIFPAKSLSLAFSHFTWGAEVGSSIDLTGYDLSTIDVDVLFGYKNSFIRMAGFGAGVHRSVHRGDNFIPVYATIQTSFRSRPSLCFFSAKIGYSFNSIEDSPTFGDLTSLLGIGFNLSSSKVAKSYILVSAGYRYFNQRHIDKLTSIDRHYIFLARLALGVNF
ncbi:MAG: hypothetical protein K2M93_06810 [Muribaculaceae bacterium]|nr:hypothetical protein [Muribaculaceae bacterium]